MSFKNNFFFCFEDSFHTWEMHVRGSRRGLETWGMTCRHSCRNVHILLEWVLICESWHCMHLGGE